ncbi:conserved oligomeric Golgi complex subunit 2-like isoform X1 [Uloborus diversus]|uniref:conserved oligomeric Golgi complex subunit 2-like isoform X1 n=1 Tax=Uloborus diversus TaxID=327109 RepID=UPI00240A50FA|nr:conserved oligomeric Golgi complex subunit 2-like isoform X1 [Uloborus diversus]
MDAMLNSKASSLCFVRDEFSSDDFSVDKFVSDCRKYASLETMQEDLNLYHKMLCAALIELINQDYTDFLNLSSNLVGLDKSIKNVASPLEQLKKEIEDSKKNLDETSDSAHALFVERDSTHKMKVLVKHVLCVLHGLKKIEDIKPEEKESLPLDVLERLAFDWNLVRFHKKKVSAVSSVLDHKTEEIEYISFSLDVHLENLFLQCFVIDKSCLLKVLRIYSVINNEQEVEKCFRNKIVKPFAENLITEENITKHGLSKVYELILEFIPKKCKYLLEVTRGTNRNVEFVPGFDFLVNSFFPEVVFCFEYIAPVYVYAPGDPELFHKNYVACMDFLDKFENLCQVQASVRRLRTHPSYQKFLAKFNLDLYFQIRFQEIAGRFESALFQPFDSPNPSETVENGNLYELNSTNSLFYCLNLCWSNDIFLVPLTSNFWHLTLQLLSRYCNWAYSSLKSNDCDISPEKAALIIKDVERLSLELTTLFQVSIKSKVFNKELGNLLELAFHDAVHLLQEIPPLSGANIVSSLIKQCSTHLKLITDIPRLYRKTNRQMPTKPSGYISQIKNCLTTFQVQTRSILPLKWKNYCLENVVEGIVNQSLEIIRDVLTSIKKMEDSLKILKRARENKPTESTTGTNTTDDDKIRHQLAIDVKHLEELISAIGVDGGSVKSFSELKELVTSADKTVG